MTKERTVEKDHQLRIEQRPWRQSKHGTVGRRCCQRRRNSFESGGQIFERIESQQIVLNPHFLTN